MSQLFYSYIITDTIISSDFADIVVVVIIVIRIISINITIIIIMIITNTTRKRRKRKREPEKRKREREKQEREIQRNIDEVTRKINENRKQGNQIPLLSTSVEEGCGEAYNSSRRIKIRKQKGRYDYERNKKENVVELEISKWIGYFDEDKGCREISAKR